MSTHRTIVPHKVIGQEIEQANLAAATLPGTLVKITVDTANAGMFKATKNAVRGDACFVVYENELFGKTAEDSIPINEQAVCYQLTKGNKFTGIVKSGVAIAVNDLLVADVDGLVDKVADDDANDSAAGKITPAGTVDSGTHVFTGTELELPVSGDVKTAHQLYIAEEACTSQATGDDRRILLRVVR